MSVENEFELLEFLMPKECTNWAAERKGDSLLSAICYGNVNALHTFHDPVLDSFVQPIKTINEMFLLMRDNLSDVTKTDVYPFFIRSYSFWRASVILWLGCQLPESYTLLRAAIENSVYAYDLELGGNARYTSWLNRHLDKSIHKKEFSWKKVLKSMAFTGDLKDLFDTLYDVCIDMGAHPNPAAVLAGNHEVIDESGNVNEIVVYQGTTIPLLLAEWAVLSIAGLAILVSFEGHYPQSFKAQKLDRLPRALLQSIVDYANESGILTTLQE